MPPPTRSERREPLRAEYGQLQAGQVLADLSSAFTDFKARHNNRLQGVEDSLDDINAALAGLRVGGGGGNPTRDMSELRDFMRGAFKAQMSTDGNEDGGYTTAEQFDKVIGKHMDDLSPMRRVCRLVSTTSGDFSILFSTGEGGSGWVGEREARPETSHPPLGKITITAMELYANPSATQKLLDDSQFNIEDFLRAEVLREFARQEGTAFVTGDGVSKPRGFLSYDTAATGDATRAFGTLEYVPTGASGDFIAATATDSPADVLVDLVYKLKAGYRQNAVWMMNSTVGATVRKFKDPDGRFIWSEPLVLGQPPILLGYPVVLNEDMPDAAANSLSIAFGDFRAGYTIADRVGLRVLRDPYTNKPYVMFYTTKRVGGGLVDSKAIKLLKFATT